MNFSLLILIVNYTVTTTFLFHSNFCPESDSGNDLKRTAWIYLQIKTKQQNTPFKLHIYRIDVVFIVVVVVADAAVYAVCIAAG